MLIKYSRLMKEHLANQMGNMGRQQERERRKKDGRAL